MEKIKVGIIGTGNIGTDLLLKIMRSKVLECTIFAGRNIDSDGIKIANKLGINTSTKSIDYFIENPGCCEIVFDSTSASVHKSNSQVFKDLNYFTIDLTPAHVGKFCIPEVNLLECLSESNVNMITCGGQATIPIIYALKEVCNSIEYVEIVATISSRSAGIGTRENIDEFTQSTRDAIMELTGVKNAKAIINLNPAEPAIQMHNTIYTLIEHPDLERIKTAVQIVERNIQKYIPGYRIVLGPVYENGRLTISVEVKGSGDYLPPYSGNLDIITCAAIKVAEEYAIKKMGE